MRITLSHVLQVVQVAAVLGGGLWAVARMDAQVTLVREQLLDLKTEVSHSVDGLRNDMARRSMEFERRSNTLADRMDRLMDRRERPVSPQ